MFTWYFLLFLIDKFNKSIENIMINSIKYWLIFITLWELIFYKILNQTIFKTSIWYKEKNYLNFLFRQLSIKLIICIIHEHLINLIKNYLHNRVFFISKVLLLLKTNGSISLKFFLGSFFKKIYFNTPCSWVFHQNLGLFWLIINNKNELTLN